MRSTRRDRNKANACISSAMRQFGGLQWLEARDEASSAGSALATWTAREGADATQGTAAKRPTVAPAGNMVVFDGIDDCMIGDCGISGIPQGTIMAFAEKSSAGLDVIILETTASAYNNNGVQIVYSSAGSMRTAIGTSTLSTYRNGYSMLPRGFVGGALNRVSNPDTIAQVWQGGVDDSAYGRQVDGVGNFATDVTYFGSRSNGHSLCYAGGVACCLAFSNLLTQGQMLSIAAKYRKVWKF